MAGWERVEAMTRDTGLAGGLEARIADPLWLLARQWQVGEFHGEDAAQPAAARIGGRSVPLTSFRGGGRPPGPLDDGAPLEAVAEATRGPGFGYARLHAAARAGRRLTRMLHEAGLDAAAGALAVPFRLAAAAHAVAAGSLGQAAADLLRRHGLDGIAIAAASPALIGELLAGALDDADLARTQAVIDDWRRWYSAREDGGPGSWDEERLAYRFSIAASGPQGEITLAAPRHDGGHLDWYTFDVAAGPAAGAIAHGLPATRPRPPRTVTAISAPVRYTGMPASRFWEFEDGDVHFGDVDAGPADLARLLVAEFATVYGRDWFVVPVPVDAGTLTELTAVEVFDTFAGRTQVPSVAQVDAPGGGPRPWRLFELTGDETGDGHQAPWLLVPPTTTGALDGPAVERVALARDEAASLAWAIEHLVEGPLGRAVDRAQVSITANTSPVPPAVATPAAPGETWRYRLEATAPPWWIPLLPERIDPRAADGDEAAQVRLRRARMEAWIQLDDGQAGPKSAFLDPRHPRWLAEEEIPRGGVRIERSWQLARWQDGTLHLWQHWTATPGRGEAASGMRWDLLDRSRAADSADSADSDGPR